MIARHRFRTSLTFAALISAGLAAACAPEAVVRGYVPNDEVVSALEVGSDNQASVTNRLGSPSVTATFDPNIWYYVHTRERPRAFLDPEIVERRVLALHFDDTGTLDQVHEYGLEDGRRIDYVSRTTPTRGRELGLLQQLFGNIGRFGSGGPQAPQ